MYQTYSSPSWCKYISQTSGLHPGGPALATDFASCSAFSSRAVHKAKGRPRPTRDKGRFSGFEGVLSGFHVVFHHPKGNFSPPSCFKIIKIEEVLNCFWRFHYRYWGWKRISDFSWCRAWHLSRKCGFKQEKYRKVGIETSTMGGSTSRSKGERADCVPSHRNGDPREPIWVWKYGTLELDGLPTCSD